MENLTITVEATINGQLIQSEVTNPTSKEEIQQSLLDQFESENSEDEEIINNILPDIEVAKIDFEVIDWGEVADYENLQDIDTIIEIFDNNVSYDFDVISAAVECDISIHNIDEAYSGSYKDDEDFAYETAMSLGEIDKNAHWPNNCIDWEQAAKELMYDYSEANGHYFRIF